MHQSIASATRLRSSDPRTSPSRSALVPLAPIGPARRQRALVAVVRSDSHAMPSLRAAQIVARLRARGDAVQCIELHTGDGTGGGLLELPRLGHSADLVALVDADDELRVFPAHLLADPTEIEAELIPDFSDLPHARTRMLPILAASRTGPRPLGALLHAIREYSRRYSLPDLAFVDPALNRDPTLLDGLIAAIQRHAHGIQWIASVEVDAAGCDGLSRRMMRAAAAAGMRGVSILITAAATGEVPALRDDGAALARAQEVARHARDAGVLPRIVTPSNDVASAASPIVRRIIPHRSFSDASLAGIAMKD